MAKFVGNLHLVLLTGLVQGSAATATDESRA